MGKLKTEVSNKYKLIGISPGLYDFHKFGTIDLESMDLEKADNLYSAGFPYLKIKADKKIKPELVPDE